MQLLKDMRVQYKIIFISMVAIIGILAIGFTSYFSVKKAQENFDTIDQIYLKGTFEIGRCCHAIHYAQLQTILAPLTTDESFFQSRIDKYKDAVREFDESLALYEVIIKNDSQAITQIDAMKRSWGKFRDATYKIMAMRQPADADFQTITNYRTDMLALYRNEVMPLAEESTNAIVGIQQKIYDDADNTVQRNDEEMSVATRNLFLMLGGAIVILLLFNRLSNAQMTYKFIIPNAIAVIGMIIIACFGYSTIKQIQSDLTSCQFTYFKGIYEIGRCRQAMCYTQVQSVVIPLMIDQDSYQSRIELYADTIGEADDSLFLYEAIIKDDPQALKQVDAAKRSWIEFKDATDSIVAMRAPIDGDVDTLGNHYVEVLDFYQNEVVPYAVETGDVILSIQQKNYMDADDAIRLSNEGISAATRNLFFVVGVIVVFVLLSSITVIILNRLK